MTDKAKKFFLGTSIISGIIFLFLSFWVHRDVFRSIDYDTVVSLQSVISRRVDVPFSYLTVVGSAEITGLVVGIIFLTSLFFGRHLFLGIFLFLGMFLLEFLGKLFIFHPDPPSMFNRYALGIHLPSSFFVHTNFSYPSGHVARTTFISVILLFFIFHSRLTWVKKIILNTILFFFLVAVLVSRIYLGEHWLSDVLGGFILGTSIASLAIGFW